MSARGWIGSKERSCLHVQGISHWAPSNIGPYSQAVRAGSLVHVSGQIALVPGTYINQNHLLLTGSHFRFQLTFCPYHYTDLILLIIMTNHCLLCQVRWQECVLTSKNFLWSFNWKYKSFEGFNIILKRFSFVMKIGISNSVCPGQNFRFLREKNANIATFDKFEDLSLLQIKRPKGVFLWKSKVL